MTMLTALLVDDEPYVLKALKVMVDWDSYGFSLLEASNGKDALEKVKTDNPDLIITDIKMPVMNGIEFIRLSLEWLHSAAEFVILSGYDDFSYAREAMLYHVGDYLLKPIDNEELNTLVSKMAAQIYEKKRKADNQSGQLSFIASQCIRRLIKGEKKASLQKRIGMLLNIGEEEDIRCILIDLGPMHGETPAGPDSAPEKAAQARQLIAHKLGTPFQLHLFEDDMGRFGIMAVDSMPFYDSIETFVCELIQELKQNIGGFPTAAISLPEKGSHSFNAVYKQALLALNYKFFNGDGKVIDYKDVRDIHLNRELCTQDLHALMETVRNGNESGIEAAVTQLFNAFTQNLRAPGSIIAYLKCFDLEMVRLIMEMDGNPDDFTRAALELGKAMECLTMDELKSSFLSHCLYASEYMQAIRYGNPLSIVNEIKNYIRQNYGKNIKLKNVAKVFYMNPVYLGQIFKKTTGMQFTDYLNTLRIEEAKKLLRRSNMQIQEVAQAVGFREAKYFSNKFKSITNLSPSAFKEKA
jgi:two-component system response regulator YesN